MNTARGHFDVEYEALFGVDRSLLLVGRLDPRQTAALSKRGGRIRRLTLAKWETVSGRFGAILYPDDVPAAAKKLYFDPIYLTDFKGCLVQWLTPQ